MTIRHISFDVWNTLLTGNLECQPARAEMVAKILPVEPDRARRIYAETKNHFDDLAEREGKAHTSAQVYEHFIERMMEGCKLEANWLGFASLIRKRTEEIFRKHPPHVLETTVATLRVLHAAGYTISIGSNTNFISGTVLCEVLDEFIPFEFKVFSDLDGYAKPHPEFFGLILDKSRSVRTKDQPEGRADLSPSQILHVGDNLICDGEGATNAGMEFFYVKGPGDLPKVAEYLGVTPN